MISHHILLDSFFYSNDNLRDRRTEFNQIATCLEVSQIRKWLTKIFVFFVLSSTAHAY